MAPSSSPQASPAIGGRYAIQRKLGAGSIGTVYLALDSRAGRPVALKVLRPDHFSAGAVERFRREFGAIAALRHPQIAEAFDFGYTDGGLPYYTREYIEGTPCAAGPPAGAPPAEFLEPILDLLEALEYLHAHGILHLDIHPGNLIVARNSSRGSVLIDFGLFRSGSGPRLTRALDSTQPFVPPPPEVLRGERLGPATDLFLAGRLLLHRLAGELAGEARLPREIPGWGARRTLELERISAKALAEDPARRFRSAGLLVRPLLPAAARRLLIAVVASRSQTLRVPKDIASRAVAAAKGSPLLLRRIARALADEWGRAGSI